MNQNINENKKTLTHYEYNDIQIVKPLSTFYFCNKLFFYFLEKKNNLLFNSLLVIKDNKVFEYYCNLVNQQFEFEQTAILDGSFYHKNLKSYLFYTSSSINQDGNLINNIVRSDFCTINNKVSYKVPLRIDFKNQTKFDTNVSYPVVFSYKNKNYMIVKTKNIENNCQTLLLFYLSDYLNNPRFLKEINIKDIYESIDHYDFKEVDNKFVLFITATFKEKSENDPINSQITFYSVIDDIDKLLDPNNEIYQLSNFNKLDVNDQFVYPVIYNNKKTINMVGVVNNNNDISLLSHPRIINLVDNKMSFKVEYDSILKTHRVYDNKVMSREWYLEEEHEVIICDDNKQVLTMYYNGFDLILIDHINNKEFAAPINKNKCNIKVLVDKSIIEIFIDNFYAFSQIYQFENKVVINKNFTVVI